MFTANKLRSWRPVTKRKPLARANSLSASSAINKLPVRDYLERGDVYRAMHSMYSLRESAGKYSFSEISTTSLAIVPTFSSLSKEN